MSKLRDVLSEDWTSDVQFINTDDHTPKRRIRARFSYVEHDRVVPDPDETLEMAGGEGGGCLSRQARAEASSRKPRRDG